MCCEQTKTVCMYSDAVSAAMVCKFSRRPVLPLSVDSSSTFVCPTQALGGSGQARLSSSVHTGTQQKRLGKKWQWLVICPLPQKLSEIQFEEKK